MAETTIYMLRHMHTEWNAAGKIQGQKDTPLTDEGRREARRWGRRLAGTDIRRIISSDLGRAVETATLVNETLGAPLETDKRLREQDWGRWTGLEFRKNTGRIKAELDEQVSRGWRFQAPGGENRLQVLDRSLAAINDAAQSHQGQTLLMVCHEGVLKCVVYHLLGRRFLPHEPNVLKNRHPAVLCVDDQGLKISELNWKP